MGVAFCGGLFKGRHQQSGQSEVAKDVRTELKFEAVFRLQALRRSHYPSIVDEDMQWTTLRELICRKLPHRGKRC